MSRDKEGKQQICQHKKDRIKQVEDNSHPFDLTRREFVQYSTFALVAAAMSLSIPGCGGSGGDSGGDIDSESYTFDKSSIEPGQVLGIKSIESTGSSEIPEDIFGISAHVDDAVIYELRPTYFREEWVGVVIPPMFQADGSYFYSR